MIRRATESEERLLRRRQAGAGGQACAAVMVGLRGLSPPPSSVLLLGLILWAWPQPSSARWDPTRRTCRCHGQDLPGLLAEHFAPRPKFTHSPYGVPLSPSSLPNLTCTEKPCCFPSAGQMRTKIVPADLSYLVQTVKRGRWMRGTAVVILFYAEWCPFSQALLPLVQCLPMFFPPGELRFFLVEESEVGLRSLIRLGIDSFPSLNIIMPQRMSEWGRAISVQSRQLLEMVLEVEKTTGVDFCDMHLFYNMTQRATCPRRGLYSPRGQSPLISRTDCRDGWGVRDWEQSYQCLALLKQEEPVPEYGSEDYLAWAALAFVLLRFWGPSLFRWARRRFWPEAAGVGGEDGPLQQEPNAQQEEGAHAAVPWEEALADAEDAVPREGALADADEPPRQEGEHHLADEPQ